MFRAFRCSAPKPSGIPVSECGLSVINNQAPWTMGDDVVIHVGDGSPKGIWTNQNEASWQTGVSASTRRYKGRRGILSWTNLVVSPTTNSTTTTVLPVVVELLRLVLWPPTGAVSGVEISLAVYKDARTKGAKTGKYSKQQWQ